MATQNGDNYQKTQNSPVDKLDPGELNGRVKVLQESRTLDSELGIGEQVLGPKLPGSAKVLDAVLRVNGAIGAGLLDLGHEAYTANDGSAVAADQNAFIDQANAGAGAIHARMGTEAGFRLEMGQNDVQVLLTNTGAATTSGIGVKVEWIITYVVD